jgi:hypothetical protein
MEQVLAYIEGRAADLHNHPLCGWIDAAEVPPVTKLLILPALATFTMGFRDLNLWVLRYRHPQNRLERGITAHTFEDETHSRMYLEDWQRLGLDERLGWRASDTLWWLFLAGGTEIPRAQGAYLRALAVADGGDPLLRYTHSEVIEAAGAVFFSHTAKAAEAAAALTGTEYRYMGPYHLARETGHMACEQAFAAQRLSAGQRERALQLADAMFALFEAFFDSVLRYARAHAGQEAPRRAEPLARRLGTAPTTGAVPRLNGTIHPTQVPLQRVLEKRRELTACHAFYLWMREHRDAPLWTLRRFVPMWAMEIMGFRDLVWYGLRYPAPAGELEHAVNRWAAGLQTHSALFLDDWRQMDLDRLLGWTAAETLEFYFLDPLVDPHRRNFITFAELGAAHTPMLRLWLIEALEKTGEDFFANVGALAAAAEAADGVRLDYLTGRHHLAHPGTEAGLRAAFKDREIDPATYGIAAGIIDMAFDVMDQHLDLSLKAAVTDRFGMTAHQAGEGPR